MYAVIVSGGKQYRVQEGEVIRLEKLTSDVGSSIEFDNVLMMSDGEKSSIGTPFLKGCTVKADVVKHGRGEKIIIIKMKRRKHHRKQMGHRQYFTEVKITGINAA